MRKEKVKLHEKLKIKKTNRTCHIQTEPNSNRHDENAVQVLHQMVKKRKEKRKKICLSGRIMIVRENDRRMRKNVRADGSLPERVVEVSHPFRKYQICSCSSRYGCRNKK